MMVRALVFDAYGTLYDVQSVRSLATDLCGDRGELITQIWRLKQLEYTWLRGLMRDYEDFWPVTRASLEFALESAGIEPTAAVCDPLMKKYLDLDLYRTDTSSPFYPMAARGCSANLSRPRASLPSSLT